MNRSLLSILLLGFLAAAGSKQQIPAGLQMWVSGSLERMGRTGAAATIREMHLSAARGEVESFQIMMRSEQQDSRISGISFSDLENVNGKKISSANIALYREHFVRVSPGSPNLGGENKPLGAGWYADALIPIIEAAPIQLRAGTNQAFWVDVEIPRDAAPGLYRGEFTVGSNRGPLCGEVSLRVWNFTLPLRPSLKSSFGLRDQDNVAIQEELLKNKLSPAWVDPVEGRDGALTGLGFWSGANYGHCSMEPPPSVSTLIEEAKKRQPGTLLYNYTADEIDGCENLLKPLRAWARNLHQAGVKNLVTMKPRAELLDDGSLSGRSAVDIWALLPVMFEQTGGAVKMAREKGNEIWSYNALAQDGYSPKWLIDYAPIDFRIQPGFISQSLGLTGLLYWRVDDLDAEPLAGCQQRWSFRRLQRPGGRHVGVPG